MAVVPTARPLIVTVVDGVEFLNRRSAMMNMVLRRRPEVEVKTLTSIPLAGVDAIGEVFCLVDVDLGHHKWWKILPTSAKSTPEWVRRLATRSWIAVGPESVKYPFRISAVVSDWVRTITKQGSVAELTPTQRFQRRLYPQFPVRPRHREWPYRFEHVR